MTSIDDADSLIIIVGGGTWGCSIALELARNGFHNITVFDCGTIPSPIAAGNDINKIMEEGIARICLLSYRQTDDSKGDIKGDSDIDYTWNKLHRYSTDAWLTDDVYRPFYHRTGYVMAACSDDGYKAIYDDVKDLNDDEYERLETPEQFRSTMPILSGEFPRWRGFWKYGGSGWVHACRAVIAVYAEASRLGVKFVTGDSCGRVVELLHDETAIQGVRTADDRKHFSSRVVLAAGANADLLLDFQNQLRPTAWTLAHVPLTEKEAETYVDLPVIFNVEKGFFIEPDAEKHELKVCDEHPGYCNFFEVEGNVRSIPFARNEIPLEAEQRARAFLNDTIPELAQRPFSFARICWDADTPDRMFLIDEYPDYKGLVLAVGGSGHSFKTMPAIGKFVVDLIKGRLDGRMKKAMRWRPETAINRNWFDTQGRFGANGKVMEFKDVSGWTNINKIEE
jgi:sarcosine oxidase / L-pipecolate oxidase